MEFGKWKCIHAKSLCLLVGTFNPLTLKAIIDMPDLITIFKVDLICYFLAISSFLVLKPSKLVLQKEKENA